MLGAVTVAALVGVPVAERVGVCEILGVAVAVGGAEREAVAVFVAVWVGVFVGVCVAVCVGGTVRVRVDAAVAV